jgi:hypothetical protein
MQYLKTHYGRAIPIIQNDTINMPNPANAGLTGLTLGGYTNLLNDSTVTFTTNMIGNTVICDGALATVTGFIDEHTLSLSDDIASDSGLVYTLYVPTPNEGFSIYMPAGSNGNLQIMTVGGDVVTFNLAGDKNASMILTVQALRVLETETALANLIALW